MPRRGFNMAEQEPSEYLLKLAALEEFERGLKYRKTYEELVHVFLGLTKEIARYCEKNGIEISDSAVYERIITKAQETIMSRISPNAGYSFKSPDYGTDSDFFDSYVQISTRLPQF